MIEALIKAVIQLSDKAIQKILILSVGLALTVFVALWSLIGFALTQTALLQITWLDLIVDVMGGFGTLLVTWFLFPAILSAIIPLFLESVVHAVETKHYPELPNARGVKLSQSIVSSVRFLLLLVILNVLILLFLLIPPVFPFVFYSVNGYLLGREYFEMISLRRIDLSRVREIQKKRQGTLFVFGVCISLLLTIPVINLLAPILATAAMVHLFEKWQKELSDPLPVL